MNYKFSILLVLVGMISACGYRGEPIAITAQDYHNAQDRITAIQVHDIFSPPVASRIYAYSNIAAYETLAATQKKHRSLAGQLHGLESVALPKDTTGLNSKLAALVAFYEVSRHLLFSEERLTEYRDSLYTSWEKQNAESFKISKDYGMRVAEHIASWMKKDNYAQTRTMPKFSVYSDEESRWQPTPPAYMDGIEPHWAKIRPFVIDSSQQFKPERPPKFSMEEGSPFYEELMEVYRTNAKDEDQTKHQRELAIAQFWDCNPYVATQKGHLMFATKKITPGAHWMGIAKIACKTSKTNYEQTVFAYTKTAITMADAFISCWDEKYRSNLIRPETLINKYIDDSWTPVLQTPPFPEYTSGHSVVSGAAAVALTSIFGDNFTFDDDTEIAYGLPIRNFTSFKAAAEEAAISRLYGGIHYRSAIENGLEQGRKLGNYVNGKLKMKTDQSLAGS